MGKNEILLKLQLLSYGIMAICNNIREIRKEYIITKKLLTNTVSMHYHYEKMLFTDDVDTFIKHLNKAVAKYPKILFYLRLLNFNELLSEETMDARIKDILEINSLINQFVGEFKEKIAEQERNSQNE